MNSFARTCLGLIAVALLAAHSSAAQEISAADGPEILHDADTLVDVIRPRPDELDLTDTVLIFTNKSGSAGRVLCKAFGKNGNAVGRAWVGVPGLGLRYALASEVANDRDFVGHVQCFARTKIIASAVLLAAGEVTDLPVDNGRFSRDTGRRILFPVVATF